MGIDSLPPVSTFGRDFNYAMWSAGTTAMLCNVPWSADYRDIVKFDTSDLLDTYLSQNAGPVINFTGMTYAKPGMPVRVSLPFNACYAFNYLRVYNGSQPIDGDSPRVFYYFVSDVRYVAPNTTELVIQLDVWQTFNNFVEFGNCYIERGHIGIANENATDHNGRDYLTIPEGLDLGNEYVINETATSDIASINDANPDYWYDIIVATTVSFEGSGGTIDAPVLNTAGGSGFGGLPNGVEFYHFPNINQFRTFMHNLSDKPWVSQGIISVMIVPNIPADELITTTVSVVGGLQVAKLSDFKLKPRVMTGIAPQWRDRVNLGRYAGLRKFLTYPYTLVEMTYSGKPLVLKPECMPGDAFDYVKLIHLSLPDPRIVVYPYLYNNGGWQDPVYSASGDLITDNAEFLDMVTGIFNLPTFSVVNNSYMSYLASNKNSIAYQHDSADWSQQRALAGNALGFNQAGAGMSLSQNLTEQGVMAQTAGTALANQTATYQALQGGAGSLIGGAASGNPAGVAGGVLGAANQAAGLAIQVNQNNQQLAINTGLARGQNQAQVGTQGYMRDTNREYADFAARGDYQNTIAGINARVQDAKMLQPSTSGQIGGDAFNLSQYKWAVHFKVKTLQASAMAAIGEYWLRYGYAVNRFGQMPSNMAVMDRFTYWKLRETYIRSSRCPEGFRQTLRGIFEKGVTVWRNPSDIGTIDMADNHPLGGITL